MPQLSLHTIRTLSKADRETGRLLPFYNGVSVNSQKVVPEGIFAAIAGYSTDGHRFLPQAAEAGARLMLTERDPEEVLAEIGRDDIGVMQVPDIRAAVAQLAFAYAGNPQYRLKIAGITGTNGKTTVSTLVHQALTKLGYKAGLMGTISVAIGSESTESRLTTGDPEQMAEAMAAMADAGCTHLVMEVSSHALDQKRTDAINFDVAAFTNLSHDHLDYHKTESAYLQAKKRLFDGLSTDAIAIVNADDASAAEMVRDTQAAVWKISMAEGGLRVLRNDARGIEFEMDNTRIASPLSGHFNVYNLAMAWLMLRAFGCTAQNAASALQSCSGARGRLERVPQPVPEQAQGSGPTREAITLHPLPEVFVDYAHTPDALRNVLETLRKMAAQRQLTVVFGCGGDRDKTKRPVMGHIASGIADVVIVTSDNPRSEDPDQIMRDILAGVSGGSAETHTETDRRAAIAQAISQAQPDGLVLIAGKGHETYQEIRGIRYPMDDVALAAAALQKRAETARATSSQEQPASRKEA
ncbi:UDP-N-acetylmuramoylalanyl-D-glutamate--2,6-diaminopimelate ligase [Cyclonatronum proteinivorum]|uniref:UDP-N-acetylmuramoyl-L-alanyl-D-glutamate--2,6-diaminopimelate ligase n=1 Tax=Cyclonatronum proteinivorum TaxID=1457365 RepID=A0A345UIP1_9BACT|nr:UDP-N-acetylmuramoyl-L-alanyl-D-glutamate--2,6-diaminopimelate ligase [Cyclonatronum proteinivorum]AXJ00343.1 UDP-N-acetylmuramoylalanyl-D-glutamate--2,6-diaminopimelate ligase [Cyclonatronum proteinivorum]